MAVHDGPEGTVVAVGGRRVVVHLQGRAPGPYRVTVGTHPRTFHCAVDGDDVHLFWDGTVHRLRIEREGARPSHRAASGSLEAPMPGKVIAIKAVPGQAVRKGEELLVVEAMKMENALRAPRDGVVRSLRARVGDMVSPGTVLVELE